MNVEDGRADLTQVMQLAVKDPRVPAEIRLGFVKKVYGILIAMLTVSFGIVAPFVFQKKATMAFMRENAWIMPTCMMLLLVHQLVNLAMSFEQCCGRTSCTRAYFKLMKTVPYNYIFLFSYAICTGVLVGVICTQYSMASVGYVFLATAGIMAALTVYAVKTKQDFTGMGMYVFAVMAGFCVLSLLGMFFPGKLMHKVIAGAGAILFSFVIIYDTQLIFGTASVQFERAAARKIEFSLDMYAFAAYQLYLDFINMFLYLLELFGKRENES